uniref:Uncharacterized protein n=1 Tax=Candidatus Kentrum sp. LFY TaxID=2126342 RepID=A0A450WNM0_9GAMM|nr:MAG: hypothetical protein BECKLFY1418C_GA0070996_104621 [Candidatus Kentron sp. LFY]
MVRKHHHGYQRPGAKSQYAHATTPDPKQAARGLARTAHGPDPASRAPVPPIHALEQPAHAWDHPAYGREQSLHGLEQSARVLEYSAFVLANPASGLIQTIIAPDQQTCALVQSPFVPVRLVLDSIAMYKIPLPV